MTKIARLIGGAGTGKTTELLKIMEGALVHFGGNPLLLGFASFTRAARAEAVTRAAKAWDCSEDLLSNKGWFRTVHSTVYKCLGLTSGDMLAGSKEDIKWTSEAIGVRVTTEVDEYGNSMFVGDPVSAAALNCWSLARATLRPVEAVVRDLRLVDDSIPEYASVVRIARKYEDAKTVENRLDFTDILLRFAGIGVDPQQGVYQTKAEGDLPEVGAWLFDEQQDASPLLDAVCRRLVSAPSVQWAYVVGDPFQSIYGFAGSSAKCFMSWEVEKERIMPKSWRCPKPIAELGEACLRRMNYGYFDRKIAPADHGGLVMSASDIEEVVTKVDPADSWLLIARTNHQAGRLMTAMSGAGKPAKWANAPEGASNRGVGLMALHRLERNEPITGREWARALPLLPVNAKTENGIEKMLVRGTKARWENDEASNEWDVIFPDEIEKVGGTPRLREAIRSGRWATLVDRGQVWRRQAETYGPDLTNEPGVRVGTIHSVKGAEADNVALLTTISKRVMLGRDTCPYQHDEECRISYVGVTRTRRTLTVIDESRPMTPCMEVL